MSSECLDKVEGLRNQFLSEMTPAVPDRIPDIRNKYLGRNGLVAGLLKLVPEQAPEDRPVFGRALNDLKNQIAKALDEFSAPAADMPRREEMDYSLPGRKCPLGTYHPITLVLRKICSFFERLGFAVAEGPEIESDYNNFTALNIPSSHPARDMHDTFYIDAQWLLRTHTSPVQIRTMEKGSPPFRIIAPGKVYRRDSDITHSPMFHQVEGLCVGTGINFGHLKYILSLFAKSIFDENSRVRLRPSYFPFTEPSAEVDISCMMCGGSGCRVCKKSGWIEILGAGMVNPQVLHNVGLDPDEFTGYAFGMGVERIAMLRYGISDIRLFYENHINFLKQFNTE